MKPIRDHLDIEAGLAELLSTDPRLGAVAAVAGPLPLRLAQPGFAGLAHIVVSQMVSRASAEAIWARILAATGGPPDAATYAALSAEQVAGFGLSGAKARALDGLAEAVLSGDVDLEAVAYVPLDEALARLTALSGIGPWTAEVYLMFCGGHPDIFPAGDVALRAAVGAALGHKARPDIAAVREIACCWTPWRSVAARLFWAYYAARAGREAAPATG